MITGKEDKEGEVASLGRPTIERQVEKTKSREGGIMKSGGVDESLLIGTKNDLKVVH